MQLWNHAIMDITMVITFLEILKRFNMAAWRYTAIQGGGYLASPLSGDMCDQKNEVKGMKFQKKRGKIPWLLQI